MMIFNTQAGRLFFFSTEAQRCSYLPDRKAVMLFADPNKAIDNATYGRLIDHGFRRSGDNVYRPHCSGCNACVPVRIPVERFLPSRSQKRAWRRNADLQVQRQGTQHFNDEHRALYHRYQVSRHESGTSKPEATDQLGYLRSRSMNTSLLECRLEGRLAVVCVIDTLPQGLSAVYTYYDPDLPQRGLGTYGVMLLVEECRRLGLPWLYLGYWIRECNKMNYKQRFRPLEGYVNGQWQDLEPDPPRER